MGTDIHLAAEQLIDDVWTFVPGPVIICRACDGAAVTQRGDNAGQPCWWCAVTPETRIAALTEPELGYATSDLAYWRSTYVEPGKIRDTWYSDRSYTTFAVLAGVRNGYGVAGAYRHEPVEPIAEGRGTPYDATPQSLAVLSNEHSPSWCLMEEIIAHDWDQIVLIADSHNRPPMTQRECCADFLERMRALAAECGERPVRIIFDFDS